MKPIGIVKFVQIQQSRMKVHEGERRVYRPDPLRRVSGLLLTRDGITGLTETGEEIIDVHNVNHPQTRNRVENSISLGFLHHYQSMRSRFGGRMKDGVAAENIILEATEPGIDPLPEQLVIVSGQDGVEIELEGVLPAPPCAEFSRFCAGRDLSPPELKDTLQFLDRGRRGYYATLIETDCRCVVRAGDRLYVR